MKKMGFWGRLLAIAVGAVLLLLPVAACSSGQSAATDTNATDASATSPTGTDAAAVTDAGTDTGADSSMLVAPTDTLSNSSTTDSASSQGTTDASSPSTASSSAADTQSGSSNSSGSSSTAVCSPGSGASADSVLKSVLQNNIQFVSDDYQPTMTVSEYLQAESAETGTSMQIAKFALVDLDNDSIPEVILGVTTGGSDDVSFIVLHYANDSVYGYSFPYRALNSIKADGTFSFSSGASDSGFGTIDFSGSDYANMITKITYSQSNVDVNNNQSVSYFVNQQSATYDEFEIAINQEAVKPDATWYDFNDDQINSALS